MSVLVNFSVGLSFRAPASEPASVTSSPSRIQVMPSATMTRLWNRPQGSRTSRAGVWVSPQGQPVEPRRDVGLDDAGGDGLGDRLGEGRCNAHRETTAAGVEG